MTYATIAGTGSYLPQRILTNADLEAIVETTSEWIIERTGILERHIASEEETTSSMAYQAALKAIEAAQIVPNDIELIVVGTATPDLSFPSTAAILQHRLGITNHCPAFDVAGACSGFIYALSVADQFIKTGSVKTALVMGAECLTRLVNWKDRTTCVLFGDGAAGVILKASDQPGVISTHLHTDGQHLPLLYAPNHLTSPKEPPHVHMKGREVFKVAVNTLNQIVDEVLTASNLCKADIDWLIPHQANLRIIQATAKKLDLPMDRVVLTIQHQGNTSAASIPLALDIAVRDGRIKRGERLLMEAFGAGFTWGSALVVY